MLRVEQYCCRAALKMLVISPNNAGEAMTCPRWRKNATTPGPRCKPGTYEWRYSRSTHSTARVTWSRITSATFGMAHSRLSSFCDTYHSTGGDRKRRRLPKRPLLDGLRRSFATGSLGTGSGVGEGDGTSADWTRCASTGPSLRMAAQVGALTAKVTAAGPNERRGVCVPAASGFFEPVHDVFRRSWRRAVQCAVDENPLDRLGHIQPGAAQRTVERHDAMFEQPHDERWRLMAGQIVQNQQQPQGWQ